MEKNVAWAVLSTLLFISLSLALWGDPKLVVVMVSIVFAIAIGAFSMGRREN